jgi:hypothetical protein
MRTLYKLISIALIVPVLSLTSCSTWWSNFKKDPVAQTETLIQSVQVILSVATVTFASVKGALPADKQPIAQAKFDEAVLAVNGAIDALHASIQTAADLQQSKPDFSKVVADLMAAVQGLQAVVDEFKVLMQASPVAAASAQPAASGSPVKLTAQAPSAATPRGYDVLVTKISALKAYKIAAH